MRGAWNREGVPRLHRGLGEAEETVNGDRTGKTGRGADDVEMEDEWAESHYSRPHWARATTETPVKIGDVQEPVVPLVDHSSEINLMSMDFYRKGK